MTEQTTRESLTPEEVEIIRKQANTPGVSYKQVAEQWNLEITHVRYIANGTKHEGN